MRVSHLVPFRPEDKLTRIESNAPRDDEEAPISRTTRCSEDASGYDGWRRYGWSTRSTRRWRYGYWKYDEEYDGRRRRWGWRNA
jgi:hypothetical protein